MTDIQAEELHASRELRPRLVQGETRRESVSTVKHETIVLLNVSSGCLIILSAFYIFIALFLLSHIFTMKSKNLSRAW